MDNLNPYIHDFAGMLPELCNIARQAGAIEKDVFENGFTAEYKNDGSPVTIADKKAEELIIRGLEEIAPEIPFIGEESFAGGLMPDISGGLYWLVDPLDGTKEFVNKGIEFTVNIALMENFQPVLGVIYVPMMDEIYVSAGSGRAFMQEKGSNEEIPISVRKIPEDGLTVVTGRRHGKPKNIDNFLNQHHDYKVKEVIECSSSLKMCMIASGKADIYPRLGPTSEWDTAAADAILNAAGGHILQLSGEPLTYGNVKEKFLNPHFIASSSGFVI